MYTIKGIIILGILQGLSVTVLPIYYYIIQMCIMGFIHRAYGKQNIKTATRHRSAAEALVSKGHNVTFVTPDADVLSENLTYIHMEKVHDAINKAFGEEINFFEYGDVNVYLQFIGLPLYIDLICNAFLDSDGWYQLDSYSNHFKFDLIIHDFIFGGCLLSYFSHKFNHPPLLLMTAYSDYSIIGSVTKTTITSAISPYVLLKEKPNTFLSRVENYILHMIDKALWEWYLYPKMDKIVAQRYENIPPIIDVQRKAAIILFNYDPVVDGIKQFPPNVIGVGGLQIRKPKELEQELKAIAENATGGLILFSMGTNVRPEHLGKEKITHILDAFRQFSHYTFVWKFKDENYLPVALPKNVFIRKWIPQNDILAHKNMKLFITHAGMLSTQESIYYAVPMLGLPVMVDQYWVNLFNHANNIEQNINRSIRKGIAEKLLIKESTTDDLVEKLSLLLTDPKYQHNIKIYSRLFRDQKETPMERAIFWIEWTMRNSDVKLFDSNGSHLNFLQIESIDVITFLVFCLLLYLYVLWKLFLKLLKMIVSSKNDKYASETIKRKKE